MINDARLKDDRLNLDQYHNYAYKESTINQVSTISGDYNCIFWAIKMTVSIL